MELQNFETIDKELDYLDAMDKSKKSAELLTPDYIDLEEKSYDFLLNSIGRDMRKVFY
jgi:hypothetical protein